MFKLPQPNFDNLDIVNLLMENMADNVPMKSKLQETQNQRALCSAWIEYDNLTNQHILHSILAYTEIGVMNNIISEKATDLKKFDAEAYMYSLVKDVLEVKN